MLNHVISERRNFGVFVYITLEHTHYPDLRSGKEETDIQQHLVYVFKIHFESWPYACVECCVYLAMPYIESIVILYTSTCPLRQ